MSILTIYVTQEFLLSDGTPLIGQHAPDHVAMACRHAMLSVKKINPTEYGPSTNCPADQKPSISENVRYCNSIDCLADWDTQEGLLVSASNF